MVSIGTERDGGDVRLESQSPGRQRWNFNAQLLSIFAPMEEAEKEEEEEEEEERGGGGGGGGGGR